MARSSSLDLYLCWLVEAHINVVPRTYLEYRLAGADMALGYLHLGNLTYAVHRCIANTMSSSMEAMTEVDFKRRPSQPTDRGSTGGGTRPLVAVF